MLVRIWCAMQQAAVATTAALTERIHQLIRERRLDVQAWYVRDRIETLVWYSCRDADLSERLRITRDAQLAAAAGLVRDGLSDAEFEQLIAAVPDNLHGIFMRPAALRLQRSW